MKYIILSLMLTNCAINTSGKQKIEGTTVSSGTIHVQVEGNVTVAVIATVLSDPTVNSLIADKCSGDQVCASNQQQTLISTLTNTLANLATQIPTGK